MMMKKGELTGVSSGFKDLDQLPTLSETGNDRARGSSLDGKTSLA